MVPVNRGDQGRSNRRPPGAAPLERKLAAACVAALCLLLLAAPFHHCTHDDHCPVCAASQVLGQPALPRLLAAALPPGSLAAPLGRFLVVRLSAVDLKVRLNT